MRAHRILVVLNGEIVEEGSHDELIRARGKYHNLWSKQTFVKSADGQCRSRSPQMRNANLTNDVDRDRSTTTMVKALNIEENYDPTQTEVGKKPVEGQEFDNGQSHKREVSGGPE
jgi:ABC-type glutathione transport system ATPase component